MTGRGEGRLCQLLQFRIGGHPPMLFIMGADHAEHDLGLKKQARFAERIEKNGLPEPPKPRVKKTEAEKLAIKRAARKRKKARLAAQEQQSLPEQDGRFFYIAGYTSGGAPYGVTWEEMGLDPPPCSPRPGSSENAPGRTAHRHPARFPG